MYIEVSIHTRTRRTKVTILKYDSWTIGQLSERVQFLCDELEWVGRRDAVARRRYSPHSQYIHLYRRRGAQASYMSMSRSTWGWYRAQNIQHMIINSALEFQWLLFSLILCFMYVTFIQPSNIHIGLDRYLDLSLGVNINIVIF